MNQAKFAVMVRDGQGQTIDCGAPKQAMKRAKQILGRHADIQIINTWNLGGPCYFFDASKADASYWIDVLKLGDTPSFIGKPAI